MGHGTWVVFYRATAKHTHGIAVEILSVCLSNACIVTKRKAPSEKSSIMTNRKSKSPTSFPMSLRWTSYVAPKPQRGLKSDFSIFRLKIGLFSKKVCYKVSLCGNFQRQSCNAFTGLSIRAQMLVGDVPFDLKYWAKVTHPLQKQRLPIDIRPYCDKTRWFSVKMWIPYARAMFLVSSG